MEAVEEKWSHEGFWEGKKDFEVEAAEDLDMGWYASQFQSMDAQQLCLATGYWTIQYWSPTWPLHSRPSAYHHCLQPPGVDPWISDSFLLKRCHAAWKWLMAQAAHSFCSNESHWKTARAFQGRTPILARKASKASFLFVYQFMLVPQNWAMLTQLIWATTGQCLATFAVAPHCGRDELCVRSTPGGSGSPASFGRRKTRQHTKYIYI